MSQLEKKIKEAERKRKERCDREKTLDKTLADSFPTSDPPSTIPDPCEGESPEETNDNAGKPKNP